mmetsp:Transcript_32845/g.82789  ORF Transcript_32845/g.82789 Transcript_32845/m.82789 type:complete len:242 (-) Transcript_32845:49-774(-)
MSSSTSSRNRLPPPSKRARTSGVTNAVCVTSSGTMVRVTPDSKTTCAASGSHCTLNSATGLVLPCPMAPPITTTSTHGISSGYSDSRSAMLVKAPVATTTTLSVGAVAVACGPGAWERMAAAMAVTAFSARAPCGAVGMSGPSSPDAPWISGQFRRGLIRGLSAPMYTSTSSRPIRCKMRRALSVVFSRVWLPHVVDTPSNFTPGVCAASTMAIASSWPGSQSSHMDTIALSSLHLAAPPV